MQDKFSLAKLFLYNISCCVQYVQFLAELMPLCNLKSEELEFMLTIPSISHAENKVQGKFPGAM